MGYSSILLGDDLSDEMIYVSPDEPLPILSVTEEKIIARASNTNYFVERNVNGETRGYVYSYYSGTGQTYETFFYRSTPTYASRLETFRLLRDFGTITYIDESAVLLPIIKRIADSKKFVASSDFNKFVGITKGEINNSIRVRRFPYPAGERFKISANVTYNVTVMFLHTFDSLPCVIASGGATYDLNGSKIQVPITITVADVQLDRCSLYIFNPNNREVDAFVNVVAMNEDTRNPGDLL